MRQILAVALVLLCGCSSADPEAEGFALSPDGSSPDTITGEASPSDAGPEGDADPFAGSRTEDGCVKLRFDRDHDHYGESQDVFCGDLPDGYPSGWVPWDKPGMDCHDGDPLVHPGQTDFLDAPMATCPEGNSYCNHWDYDCSGKVEYVPAPEGCRYRYGMLDFPEYWSSSEAILQQKLLEVCGQSLEVFCGGTKQGTQILRCH